MNEDKEKDLEHNDEGKTVQEVFDGMSEEQKEAVYAIVGQAVEDASNGEYDEDNNEENDDEGEEKMKHNVFDNDNNDEVLQHSEILGSALADAKKYGSLRESVIEHAAINNITDIGKLFPDATALNKEPIMIEKDQTWVGKVMNAVKHTPFSRVKVTFGRMTEPQARAKGYIKGNKKVNIQMQALNRVVTPTTVYIKNEIDRDDVIDITDFDVVAWQKREMRKELDKELALAALLGDGIVTVPEMEQEAYSNIVGVIVNMADYTMGADKGGSVNMFDDFDIDYNQMKYLMETRCSGALTVPYSAIVLKKAAGEINS